ncbi:MAG: hypothetical protein M3Y08_17635 [Fibrobacterota bacterium]|nr:hypothetical protein [Fibrobacterota bacterium]
MKPQIGTLRPAIPSLGLLAGALGFWLLSACNVFSPLAADGEKDLTYRGLLLKGNQAINNSDYTAAENYYAMAKKINPRGSEAYLFHSKALASMYRIDYGTLNKEFETRRNTDGKGKAGIPFIDSNTTVEKIDSTYYPVAQSVENLEHILRHAKDTVLIPGGWLMLPDGDTASDGKISEGVARLDLGLLQIIKGMLGPLDLDGNNRIDRNCGANICPDMNATCVAGDFYRKKCKDGPASEVNGFLSFKNLTRSIDINNLDTKDVRARQVSSNPNEINDFLDKMAGPVAASSFNLDSVTNAMNSHQETKLSGQFSEITTNISDLTDFLSYMRFDDNIDNDFDNQSLTGPGTRLVWHDYDKDGAIHFNYDEDLTGYIGTANNSQARNIGHPLHRHLHPDLYVKFADTDWTQRKISLDTSKNSRKATMIKHCQEVAKVLNVNGKVTEVMIENMVSQTCSTHTSILKANVTRPARSDWLGGTYGVDEEMIDDRDNDYDGLTDEDARNAKGMDDDDDALLSITMIGTNPDPMIWKDVAGHGNKCPDIDTTQAMQAAPLSRQFCIGSLEHRIHLAQNGGNDSLNFYYQIFLGEGPSSNCLEDFDKLDQSYKDLVGLKASTDNIVLTACRYKHIWKRGIPPNSEWTSGTFGMDEELPDGVDNDGDGWIDEDRK